MASAFSSFQKVPAPFIRRFTTRLTALSIAPEPMGSFLARSAT